MTSGLAVEPVAAAMRVPALLYRDSLRSAAGLSQFSVAVRRPPVGTTKSWVRQFPGLPDPVKLNVVVGSATLSTVTGTSTAVVVCVRLSVARAWITAAPSGVPAESHEYV